MQGDIDYADGRKIENMRQRSHEILGPRTLSCIPTRAMSTWFVTEDIRWGYIPPIQTSKL
jgi:nitrate/nitrite transport system substrate-binding protein